LPLFYLIVGESRFFYYGAVATDVSSVRLSYRRQDVRGYKMSVATERCR